MTRTLSELSPFNLRWAAALAATAGTLFWIYTFYAIAHVPPGDGTGFQWLAVFPLGIVFALFVLPTWLLVVINRLPWLSLIVGLWPNGFRNRLGTDSQ